MHNFRSAIKTTIIFILCVSAVSALLSELYFQGENWIYQDAKERTALSGKIDYLISGASHGMRAFKPEIIDKELGVNSYNLSGALMTMQGRYELLKVELERNPVKTVVIELTYNSMTRNRVQEGPEGDIYILGRLGSNLSKRISLLMNAFQLNEYGKLYYDTIDRSIRSLEKVIRGTYRTTLEEYHKGYFPTPKPDVELDDNYSKTHNTEKLETKVYEYNEKYLESIVLLCQQKGAQIILVTTPLSLSLTCACSNLDVFYDWYTQFAKEHNIEYYDFNLLKSKQKLLADSEHFFDRTHLNDSGASVFSLEFCRIMKKVNEGENVAGLYYGSYNELDESSEY